MWSRILLVVGLAAMLIGALDPLEGSVVILAGSGVAAFAAYLGGSARRKLLYLAFGLVAVGVAALFVLSALGGTGGNSGRSVWWGLCLIPYPVGWVVGLVGAILALRRRVAGHS
jgi:hypothetical protein